MFKASKIEFKKALFVLAVLAIILPFFTFAGNTKKIYVDTKAGDTQDGSSDHPYKTIDQALKKANDHTKIFVGRGTYKENLIVPKGVKIYGNDRDETIIKAQNDDDSAVYLNGGSELYKLTIKDGKNGVKVADGGRVKIIRCKIAENDKDGVIIYAGSLDDKNKVTISETDIEQNGRNGIFSEKRNIIIYKSTIDNNGSDGASFEAGTKAWIEGSTFENNSASGMKAKLDNAQIFTKGNKYINNKREGLEVNAYGATGRIDINKSKFENNGNYGISRVQRKTFSANIWNGLTIENTLFSKLEKGGLSGVFGIFN
ncbi:MAG TPA: hypothetical protein DCS28_02955 [Candidatus Moranbacteria bacterium]|nr:hypothetical protein [Candidatus Moranbacteria bacterium]HAT74972.1 hypothetical protein [Candidatus Moranbacteria bacterium]